MGLRAGSPATERRTWSRSLRGTILAGSSSSRAHDNDRLRLPPASPPRSSKTEKKESAPPPPNHPPPPFATLSSNSSLDHRRTDASNADDGFTASPCVSESAKVVLALLWQIFSGTGFPNQFFNDLWVVGFGRADHGRHNVELGRRASRLARAVLGAPGS